MVSPYLDQEVITSGLVSVDLEDKEPGGIVLLDETCSLSEEASRGIYINLGKKGDLVDVGDEIQVRGTVRERAGETCLDADPEALVVLSVGNPLPEPVNLNEYLRPPLAFGYEKWEGQRVVIARANLVDNSAQPERLLAVPQLSLKPSQQLVCFQERSFALAVNGGLLRADLEPLQGAVGLEDLVGLVRQDQHGYYLQLLEEPILKLTGQAGNAGELLHPSAGGDSTAALSATPGDPGLTPGPSNTPEWTPTSTAIPSPTYFPVQLLITEIMPNPAGEEPGGEWIEIYHPSGGRLSLDGIKVGDEISPAGKEGMLRFPEGYFIDQGQVMVVANQARVFESRYGFPPDFELEDSDLRVPDLLSYDQWGSGGVKLSNSGDDVLLVDPWDQLIDLVVYGKVGGSGFSPPVPAPEEGHSLERYPPEQDLDQAGDWREKAEPSPGRLDRSLPTPQYTQTRTPTASLIPETATAQPTLTPPGETLTPVPSATPTTSQTPSITPRAIPTGTPTSRLTATPERTKRPTNFPIKYSTRTPVATKVIFKRVTISPSGTPTATLIPTISPTNGITPTLGPTGTAAPLVIINEIHADPDPVLGDANRDGQISSDDDEFLEMVNISGVTLDLSGWQVHDEIRSRYTFPEGTYLASGCGLVLFGGGEPAGDFGGSLVFTAGSLGLNNTGDLVILYDLEGLEVARAAYGLEGNQNQSLTRNPDLVGSLPFVLHSEVPESGGNLFSPGTRIDLSGFGDCP